MCWGTDKSAVERLFVYPALPVRGKFLAFVAASSAGKGLQRTDKTRGRSNRGRATGKQGKKGQIFGTEERMSDKSDKSDKSNRKSAARPRKF